MTKNVIFSKQALIRILFMVQNMSVSTCQYPEITALLKIFHRQKYTVRMDGIM